MKVLYDHLCFWENFGGVSRYFSELMNNIPNNKWLLSIMYSNNLYLSELLPKVYNNFFLESNFRGKAWLINQINKPNSINALMRWDFDIYHPTHYDPYGLKYVKNKKIVMTIHDMNYFKIPEYYNKNNTLAKYQEYMAMRVDKIIAVSNKTKIDIMEVWGINESKIEVIHHGKIKINNINVDEEEIKKPYILYVGSRNKYKNFERFLLSIKQVFNKNEEYVLICTGNIFSEYEKSLINDLNLKDRIYNKMVDEIGLLSLYKNASVFVYPSLYEGFGMPLIEAFCCGCPVVCSYASCFPEIAGNAAIYFDPYSISDIAVAIESVINNKDIREKLIVLGKLQSEKFDWNKSAKQHISLYEELI